MENKKVKFVYNPEALDICEFDIVVDHLHWKLLCKQAADFTVTPRPFTSNDFRKVFN